MDLHITLTPAASRKILKNFGTALNNEIIENLKNLAVEQGQTGDLPEELIEVLQKSLTNMLQKVGKKEKKQQSQKKEKTKKQGIRKRFKYKSKDQKGKNGAFLRINVDRETREVSKVNESNWTEKANKKYQKVYGMGPAYIIPAGAGKKANIVQTLPYQKKKPLSNVIKIKK